MQLREVILVLLLAVLTACTQPPTMQQQPASEFAAEGLHPVQSSGFGTAYVRPNANLPSYRALIVDEMDVSNVHITTTTAPGTMRRDWQVTPEREVNLQNAWARATDQAFAGYERSGTGGKVVRMTAALTQLAPGRSSSAVGVAGSGTVSGTSQDTVDVSAEFRLYDQASGELLAVIRDRRTIAMLQWSRAAGADMVGLFNSWAALLHTRVSGR